MFAPIKARLASSCSRKGISEVATDQIWFGDTSISSTSFGAASTSSPSRERQVTPGPLVLAGLGVDLGVRLGDDALLLLGGVQVDDLLGDHALLDDPGRAS